MIGKREFETVRTLVAQHDPPVLSLYLDLDPTESGSSAPLLRAREALELSGAPGDVVKDVLKRLEADRSLLSGRSLALFSCRDFFNTYPLQVDLPLAQPSALAQWGEPFVAPFLLALSEHRHYGVLVLAEKRWRFYEVYLGEIEALAEDDLEVNDEDWRLLQDSAPATAPGVPARGGAGKDNYARRQDAWTHRFRKSAVARLGELVRENDIDRLFVVAATDSFNRLEGLLPQDLRRRVAGHVPQTLSAETPGDLLRLVEPLIEDVEQARALALLERAGDKGVRGRVATLEALQEGRLDTVLAAWHSDILLEPCDRRGNYIEASETLSAPSDSAPSDAVSGEPPQRLLALLPDLATQYGTKLLFVRGEAEADLSEVGGMAGLARW